MKILKFSAVWCPSCLIMNNVINKIKNEYKTIEVINYDYDMDEDLVSKYNIGEILPVLIFISDDNNELDRLIGEHSYSDIANKIEGLCKYEKNN